MHFLNDKKKILYYCLLLLISAGMIIFMYNNSFLYNKTIVKVIADKTIKTTTSTDVFGISGTSYTQELTVRFENSEEKGKITTIKRSYTKSEALNGKYKKGDFLFVTNNSNGKISVSGAKRDYLLVASFCIFVIVLLFVGRKKGNLTLLSLVLNVGISVLTVYLYSKHINIIALSLTAILLFIVFTTLLINGRNMKSYISIISVIISITASCLLIFFVILINGSKGVHFEQMDLVIKDVKQLFYIQLIIGNLGGIMDICVTMSSSISEIIETNPSITSKELNKSAKVIGSDIMGTMTSTILFAYIAGSLPMIMLLISNGYSFAYVIDNNLNNEIIRALAGCIGMIIAIPVSTFISIKLLHKKEKME